MKRRVRVSIHPHIVYEVLPNEYLDLKRQGLIVWEEGEETTDTSLEALLNG